MIIIMTLESSKKIYSYLLPSANNNFIHDIDLPQLDSEISENNTYQEETICWCPLCCFYYCHWIL